MKQTSRYPFYTLTIFNNQGKPAKKYDLLQCTVIKMRSTGYYVGEKTVPSERHLPWTQAPEGLSRRRPEGHSFGTRLYVEGYGYAYAADTGSRSRDCASTWPSKTNTKKPDIIATTFLFTSSKNPDAGDSLQMELADI